MSTTVETTAKENARTLPAWVSCPNPFYLLSAACVLHGTGWNADDHGLPPWLIPVLVAAYIAVMAATARCIVRWWKVWDDARTILVTLFLLFLELALSLDQFAVAQPERGVAALFAGWLFAAGLVEGLLRGLRMRLPGCYRASLHVQLALMFLYPVLLIPGTRTGDNRLTTDLLGWYAVAIAAPLLMLWPAVRQGAAAVRDNGTPWPWPLYPWTTPVVLAACLLARSFSLCLTFDAAPTLTAEAAYWRWHSIWGAEFAAPTLFALAVLLLEAGVVTRRRLVRWGGLLLPVLAAVLCAVGGVTNPARQQFLDRLTDSLCTPLWLALLACGAFYVVAMLRHVQGAWRGLAAVVIALTCIPAQSLHLAEWSLPTASHWWLLGAGALAAGMFRQRTLWCLEGTTYLVFGAWIAGVFAVLPTAPDEALALQAWLTALLVVTLVLDDELARVARAVVLQGVLLAAVAAVGYSLKLAQPWWLAPADLLALAVLLRCAWWVRRTPGCRGASTAIAIAAYTATYWQGAAELWKTTEWNGLPSFAAGLVLLHLGVLVSALKGGMSRSLKQPEGDAQREFATDPLPDGRGC